MCDGVCVCVKVARTVKFLSGISVCSYVLSPEWVEQCEREGQLVDEEGFTLQDSDAEETFSMDIGTTLSRAKRGKLLQVDSGQSCDSHTVSCDSHMIVICCLVQGHCVYATANVQPSHDSLREVIECAGGKV